LLASDTASSSAMLDAQLAMITGKKYSAPFYWAPFVLVGDWR
jgi:CHAT domain-containing protein